MAKVDSFVAEAVAKRPKVTAARGLPHLYYILTDARRVRAVG